MPTELIQHALGLHFHQPADALLTLLHQDAGELRRILLCYDRLVRHAHKYAHVARLHVAISEVLLKQLRDPAFIVASRHLADVPAIVEGLRSASNIEFVGTGLHHAPLPLIPAEDWEEQLQGERATMEALLGRAPQGYFPPQACFTAELVPALVRAGYTYVLLPHTALLLPNGEAADPYRAYRLRHGKAVINVVPWDQGFSRAQESGMDAAWLADESRNGVALSPPSSAPYLLTTWSDGEAGEWFRRMDEEAGFFGHFFSPCMEFCETGEFPVHPVHLADYLLRYPPKTEVTLAPPMQTDTLLAGLSDSVKLVRKQLFAVVERCGSLASATSDMGTSAKLREARALIMRAEESSLLLGDAEQHANMLKLLDQADKLLPSKPKPASTQAVTTGLTNVSAPLQATTKVASVPLASDKSSVKVKPKPKASLSAKKISRK